jgi:phosphopantothenoylcysteine decarboxylase/phosphopantothenate--cysteine ligase
MSGGDHALPLSGKWVVLGVTGSIAAVETVKLVHLLKRRGARVQAVMSPAACGIISPDALTYATGQPVITRISGMVEHVAWCGEGGGAAVLLIAPATANSIAKIALGIDDTPVTTFATTAIGSGIPVIIAPAMHGSMYRHPAILSHLAMLERWGLSCIPPRMEEGKAKIAPPDEIVLYCERAVLGNPLAGTHVLITSGPCREPLDDVRVLTTRSTGFMGREIALQAFRLGAQVTLVAREGALCADHIPVETSEEMHQAVHAVFHKGNVDIYISAAAISDYAPERVAGKIASGAEVSIRLIPLPKLIAAVMESYAPFTVAFKAGWDGERGAAELLGAGADLVVANTPDEMGSVGGGFVVIGPATRFEVIGTKEEAAEGIWSEVIRSLGRKKERGARSVGMESTGDPPMAG